MIASYPMHALKQIRPDINNWWQHIVKRINKHGTDINARLINVETDLYKHWLDPQLLFSQTCGYPLVTVLKNNVKLIGTPVYDSTFCRGADYRSLFIVRAAEPGNSIEDFAGKRFAYNGIDSQSGFNAVKTYLSIRSISFPFFGQNILSGGHQNSIAKVANNEADICAVDCVTYAHLQRHLPESLNDIRILTTTDLTPGLPFITSIRTSDEAIQSMYNAIKRMCANESLQKTNSRLLIKGISRIPLDIYMQMIRPVNPGMDRL